MCSKKTKIQNSQIFSVSLKEQKISIFYYKTEKYLVFQNETNTQSYYSIPNYIFITQQQNSLLFENLLPMSYGDKFFCFKHSLLLLIKNFNKTFKKKLLLKGLGMRIQLTENSNTLKLKLGFSYIVHLTVPNALKIFTNKNLLIVEGFNSVLVGNFITLVRSLKYPNIYNGKGFWLKHEIIKLKPVKKT
jgi:hypothetical protein